jgi:hypothetical protein
MTGTDAAGIGAVVETAARETKSAQADSPNP